MYFNFDFALDIAIFPFSGSFSNGVYVSHHFFFLFAIVSSHVNDYNNRNKVLGPVVQNLIKLLANLTLEFIFRNMANTLIFYTKNNVGSFSAKLYITILNFYRQHSELIDKFKVSLKTFMQKGISELEFSLI